MEKRLLGDADLRFTSRGDDTISIGEKRSGRLAIRLSTCHGILDTLQLTRSLNQTAPARLFRAAITCSLFGATDQAVSTGTILFGICIRDRSIGKENGAHVGFRTDANVPL